MKIQKTIFFFFFFFLGGGGGGGGPGGGGLVKLGGIRLDVNEKLICDFVLRL